MCKQDHEIAEVNKAKCWAIPVLIFGIISLIGLLLSGIVGPLVAGIGGLLGTIGSSILICCGPEKGKPGGDGKLQAAMVLQILGGLLEIGGAVVGVILFFGWKAGIEDTCGLSTYGAYAQACVDLAVGIVGALVWPSVVISIAAGIIMLVAGYFAMGARTAMMSKGGSA